MSLMIYRDCFLITISIFDNSIENVIFTIFSNVP